ncbi:MAG: hypothetical protein V7641_771 [Blastocatellia bacterium]
MSIGRAFIPPQAYQLYLKGRYFWNKRTPDGFKKAIEYFRQAITLDPNYALAYAGLADCYTFVSKVSEAKTAIEKALQIDEQIFRKSQTISRL